MATSVLFACGLNERQLPPLTHISEESQVDGTFLISLILGQRLRISNAGILLVCLQNNYQHYFYTGMRLGYNCNIFLNKTLSVLDPLTDIARNLYTNDWIKDNVNVCELLVKRIRDEISCNHSFSRINKTILIDNLSILYNLGSNAEQVMQLYHGLINLTEKFENLSVVTKMNNCDIYCPEDNNLSKLANIHLKIVKFKSGQFREVDGKLLIKRLQQNQTEEMCLIRNYKCKEVLYKINDRNIKIFNSGEIGLQLQ